MNKIALWIICMQMIGQSNERSSETKEKLVCMKGADLVDGYRPHPCVSRKVNANSSKL